MDWFITKFARVILAFNKKDRVDLPLQEPADEWTSENKSAGGTVTQQWIGE